MKDDYDMFVLKRTRDPVREVTGMQDKLSLRPDLAPVVNWCMAWIRAARRQGVLPAFENMKSASTSEQAKNPTKQFLMVQSLLSTHPNNALSTGPATWNMKKR